jgi:hypothetical protein
MMRGALSVPALVVKKKYAAKTPITIVTEIEHRREPGKWPSVRDPARGR